MKLNSQDVFSTIIVLLLGWGAFQLYGMNANMAVITYKVDENYNMIKPMWQDFLVRSAKYNEHKSNFYGPTNIKASAGED
tara:strand:+ start:91 stop:330 length:240 start_codon:yes stop_codon:yes gene_type:complete